jgi:hypothetical protein
MQLPTEEAAKGAAELARQRGGTTDALREPAASTNRVRQELAAATRRAGGTQRRALLRHRRHAALSPARAGQHFEAAAGSCRRLQPEPDPAPVAGCGHAAGVDKPGWASSCCSFMFCLHADRIPIGSAEAKSRCCARNLSQDYETEHAAGRAKNQLFAHRLLSLNAVLLTFKLFSVCKDFFMASMRRRLLVELSQA